MNYIMRNFKLNFCAFLIVVFTATIGAQNEDNPWLFSVGLSAVDLYPTGGQNFASGPQVYHAGGFDEFFNVQDHWNVGLPYLSLGRYLDKDVSFVLTGTYNRIKKWGSTELASELMFLSLDGSFNYSFANLLKSKKIDPFLGIGGGYTWIEEGPYNSNGGGSGDTLIGWGHINVSLGASYWFNEHIGLTLQTTYNHVDKDDTDILPQHWRHSFGLSLRYGGKDRDGDGIYDRKDLCPDVPGLKMFNGCPDTDGDGVQDSDDRCPNDPGSVEFEGCPDSDGDGVSNDKDQCPNVAGLPALAGCPDADGDGITDADDDCPGAAGPRGNRGCPWPDSDGDSVLDKDDQCPNEAGTVANNGCPEDPSDIINEMLTGLGPVTFNTGQSSILKDAEILLLEVVAILNAYPETKFVLEGHTDSKYTEKFNQRLSEKRASSVLNFLTANGIDVSRLSTVGFGEMAPVASNDTLEGRAQNRRVEVKLAN
jgi:outer membrane protein OmpA-like peptidoglycan-associated protein/outer membrane protein W